MSEAKFTKGKWFVEVGCSQAFVAHDNKFIHESNVDFNTGDREERVANVYLIAAAPKMYEMLAQISDILDGQGATYAVERIESLLAEARGEQ